MATPVKRKRQKHPGDYADELWQLPLEERRKRLEEMPPLLAVSVRTVLTADAARAKRKGSEYR